MRKKSLLRETLFFGLMDKIYKKLYNIRKVIKEGYFESYYSGKA